MAKVLATTGRLDEAERVARQALELMEQSDEPETRAAAMRRREQTTAPA